MCWAGWCWGELGGHSWISSEVLITSLLLLGFVQVLNNLGESLAGGNLVAEGRFSELSSGFQPKI